MHDIILIINGAGIYHYMTLVGLYHSSCQEKARVASGFGMRLGFLFLGTKLSSTICLVK